MSTRIDTSAGLAVVRVQAVSEGSVTSSRGGRRRGIPDFRRSHVSFSPGTVASLAVVLLAVGWALFPEFFTFQSPIAGNNQALASPSSQHWFGTDALGRDLYTRVVYGASNSLRAAVIAVFVGATVGSLIGTTAGTIRGRTDAIFMRFVDVLLSIPTLLLSLSVIILLGFGVVNAAIAVGVAAVASFARLSRSKALQVSTSDYVEAAYGSGATFGQVLLRHVLPNSLGPIVALAALQTGTAILGISTLGFLGYGAQPPTPEWGLIIAEGRNYVATSPWVTVLPGVVLVAVVLATNHLSHHIQNRDSWRTSP
ncbi:ABC transporter permease [Actinomycetaceae bacterium L2_0104]